MLPLLDVWPGVQVGTARLLIYVAVALCILVTPSWAAVRENLDRSRVRIVLILLAIIVLAGGRAHFLLNHPDVYEADFLAAVVPWRGGFHIGGGIIALALATPWIVGRVGLPLGRLSDALVFPVGASIVIARFGCFLHGCCVGAICQRPWCITFPHESAAFLLQSELRQVPPDALRSLPVLPLQLGFMAAGMAVATLGWVLQRRKRYDGQVAVWGLVVFAFTTTLLECLRGPDPSIPRWGPLSQLLWTGLFMSLASAVVLAVATVRHRNTAAATSTAASAIVRSGG